MSEKSHVAMDMCFLCNEPKGIVLDRRLRNSLPREMVTNMEPCDKCKEYMAQGIILISFSEKLTEDEKNPYRTGHWCVVKDHVEFPFNDEAITDIRKRRVAFIEDEVWAMMGLPQ